MRTIYEEGSGWKLETREETKLCSSNSQAESAAAHLPRHVCIFIQLNP